MLAPGVQIIGYMTQIGPHGIDRDRFDWDEIPRNPFWTPDAQAAVEWADYLERGCANQAIPSERLSKLSRAACLPVWVRPYTASWTPTLLLR